MSTQGLAMQGEAWPGLAMQGGARLGEGLGGWQPPMFEASAPTQHGEAR